MYRLIGSIFAMSFTAIAAAQAPTQAAFVRPAMAGQQIDVGGRHLHLHCIGEGPTVVIEAAAATWTSHYVAVQKAIAPFARVCTYDRAGLGWSDPTSAGRSIQDRANDLNALLNAAKLDPPYILVGHSLGGLIVRLYASEHRSKVAGVVLVESSNELINFSPAYKASRTQRITMIDSGLKVGKPGVPVVPMPPSASPEAVMATLPEILQATKDELASFEMTPGSMRTFGGFGTLADTPLIVIRRGRTAQPPNSDDIAWQNAQTELLKLSTRSELIVAEKSGHMVPMEEPDVVAIAVKRLVSAPAANKK